MHTDASKVAVNDTVAIWGERGTYWFGVVLENNVDQQTLELKWYDKIGAKSWMYQLTEDTDKINYKFFIACHPTMLVRSIQYEWF